MAALQQRTIDLLRAHQDTVVAQWGQQIASQGQDGRLGARELDSQVREFWRLFQAALSTASSGASVASTEWQDIRQFLEQLSRERVLKGFTSAETASFLFSLKRPLFELIQQNFTDDSKALGDQLWVISELIDTSACTA
jgi:rsbT co-antagonist protein RsbR